MEMAERGVAPFTAAGVGTAVGNAASLLRGAISPLGLAGLMTTAGGVRPTGLLGNILSGNIQNIPGQTPYDRDLMDALNQGRLSRAQITAQQLDRNAARSNPDGGAQHDRQGVSAGAGPGGRGPLDGGAYGGWAASGAMGSRDGCGANWMGAGCGAGAAPWPEANRATPCRRRSATSWHRSCGCTPRDRTSRHSTGRSACGTRTTSSSWPGSGQAEPASGTPDQAIALQRQNVALSKDNPTERTARAVSGVAIAAARRDLAALNEPTNSAVE
jgi:hypothetical protein